MTQPADTYGLVELPATEPTQPAGDPLLCKLACLFSCAINTALADAWTVAGVAPGQKPVKGTFTHNPEEVVFNDAHLPGLFVYRSASIEAPADFCSDHRMSVDEVTVLWVYPVGTQDAQKSRIPIANMVVKTVDRALRRNRDASWIDEGDTDTLAATIGSNILERCGLWRIEMAKWAPVKVAVAVQDSDTRRYAAVDIKLRAEELFVPERLALTDVTNTIQHEDTSPSPLVFVEQLLEPLRVLRG